MQTGSHQVVSHKNNGQVNVCSPLNVCIIHYFLHFWEKYDGQNNKPTVLIKQKHFIIIIVSSIASMMKNSYVSVKYTWQPFMNPFLHAQFSWALN